MGRHHHPALGRQSPERLVQRVERGSEPATGQRDRGVAYVHHESPPIEQPGEFVVGELGIEKGDGGYGEDAVLVAIAPVLLEPEVEPGEHLAGGFGVALESLLQANAQRREQQCGSHALLVHHLQPPIAIAVFGPYGLEVPEGVAQRLPLRVSPVPGVERSGTSHRVKGGVGNVAIDLAAHHEAGPSVDYLEAGSPGAQGGIHVASKCVESFVIVAIEVEELEIGHAFPPFVRVAMV
jgi:hypothetical protein